MEGSVFDVRVTGNRAEAMRVNAQYAPRFGPIRELAAHAMALVSGCTVKRVTGDQALAFGALDCGQGAPPPRVQGGDLHCVPERGTKLRGVGEFFVEVSCYPA